MSDLISKQAVINAIANTCFWLSTDNWEELTKCINSIPSVENKGEWILDETDNSVECNKCLCQIYPNDISYGEPHFCPNCGADMRGKAK